MVGGLPGMLSRTILVPELNLGIVVLTNSDPGGYSYYSIPEIILDAYLGIEQKDWIREESEFATSRGNELDSVTNAVWEKIKNNKSIHFDLKDFVGNYRDNWIGDVEISLKDNKLLFESKRSPKLNGQMYY